MKAAPAVGVAAAPALTVLAIFFADGYQLYVVALLGLTAVVGVGLNVILGLTGQISLGHVGFYAIGAYVASILTVTHGWSFWPAFVLAGAAAGAAGVLLAIPALRVTGPYLAMVTIAFGFVVEQGAAEWKEVTGGWNGIMNIPTPAAFGYAFDERAIALFVVAFTTAALVLFARLKASPWGLAMRAVRDSEIAGQSLGLDLVRIRTMAFALSAVLAGLAGAVFASMTNFISPESFPFFQSILFLLVVMIGGSGTVLGPLFGAVVVVLLPELLSFLAEYRLLFVGALLLAVLWLAPEGVAGAIGRFTAGPPQARAARSGRFDAAAFLAGGRSGEALHVEDLRIAFGGVQAVTGVGLTARAGEVTSIIGPNGAGKTTLLNLMGGFYRPDSGRILLGGRDLAGRPSHVVARAGIGRTYQTTQLFPRMSVSENLLVALRGGRLGSIGSALFGRRRDEGLHEAAEGLLAFAGYEGAVDRPAGALPHVDKRLVEIARALATRPRVLMLDEPTAGLSRADTGRVGALLRRIAAAGVAVILVEHDMNLVMGVSDHVVVLDAGRAIADGVPAEVRTDPAVLKAYLGEGEGVARPAGRPAGPSPRAAIHAGEGVARREGRPAAGRRPPAGRPGGGDVLAVRGLAVGYGAAPVLHGIGFTVREGEFVTVLGANGAGKSTLMRAISGLHRPIGGEVLLMGRDVAAFSAHRIAGDGLILVPEGRQVFPELSVEDNIALGGFARPDFEAGSEVERMLDRFPALRARRGGRAGLLSGGEQQMLAIARGLVAKPKILMLDEPSLGLAPALVNDLYTVLAELRDEGITILLVDQMAALALSVADRGYVIESGRVVHEGTAEEIRGEPALERAYLGGFGGGGDAAAPG